MDPISVYEQVLAGKLKKFPNGFWKGKQGKSRAVKILRYLREKTGVPVSEVPKVFTKNFLRRCRVYGVLAGVFGDSTTQMMEQVWPLKFKEWELPSKSKWKGKKGLRLAAAATRELFGKLGISGKKIPEYAGKDLFQDYGLAGMLTQLFSGSVYLAIENAWPGKFTWEDLRHSIRSDQQYVSNHGHIHKSMFERRIDDYIGELGLKHEHNVRYPGSRLDCDIVIWRGRVKRVTSHSAKSNIRSEPSTRVYVECAGMMHLEKYRKKMQKKREIARKYGLKLIELYLKDDWKEIKRKIRTGLR